ncbi:MAG TPA: YqgE/AlgH family protein, partial [Vulgatibacter sp.]
EFEIGDELAICSNQDAVRAIVHGDEPRDFRLILGYAGWGPGQLEAELKEGVWLPGPVGTALVFETQRAALWDAALQETTGAANATFQGKQWGLA